MTPLVRLALFWLLVLNTILAFSQHIGDALSLDSSVSSELTHFLPKGATLVKQMNVAFDLDRPPELVLAYFIQENQYDYRAAVRVLEHQKRGWELVYEEENFVSTGGGNPVTVDKVGSATGNEALVVVVTFSGAGTSTDWHLVAKRASKFVKINSEPIRSRVLRQRQYQFGGYNGVTVEGNTIYEDVPGYSYGQARCCPDRPSLKIALKFSGAALRLAGVKAMPFDPPK